MLKILLFVKRKAGMTFEEFRDYYETTHAPLALSELKLMRKYVRNYVLPMEGVPEPEFDVLTELWFDDMAALQATSAASQAGGRISPLVEDELNLMDRASMRTIFVDERGSD